MKIIFYFLLIPTLIFAKSYDIFELHKVIERVGKDCHLKLTSERINKEKLGDNYPMYTLHIENASPNKEYCLVFSKLNGNTITQQADIVIDENGRGSFFLDKQPLIFALGSFLPGEYGMYTVISNDEKEYASITLTSNPLSTTKNGYELDFHMVDPHGEFVIINAGGFEPNEEISYVLSSEYCKKTDNHKLVASENGGMSISLSMEKAVQESIYGGVSSITLTGKNGNVSMDFPWGRKWLLSPKA